MDQAVQSQNSFFCRRKPTGKAKNALGILEKLNELRNILNVETTRDIDGYLLDLLKEANYDVHSCLNLHFEKQEAGNSCESYSSSGGNINEAGNQIDKKLEGKRSNDIDITADSSNNCNSWPKVLGYSMVAAESTISCDDPSAFLQEKMELVVSAQKLFPHVKNGNEGKGKKKKRKLADHSKKIPNIVRLSAMDQNSQFEQTFARLPFDYASCLCPLLNADMVNVKAICRYPPTQLRPFSKIPVALEISISSGRIFELFDAKLEKDYEKQHLLKSKYKKQNWLGLKDEDESIHDVLRDSFFELLQLLHIDMIPSSAPSGENEVVENSEEKLEDEFEIVCEETKMNDTGTCYLIAQPEGINCDLRPHQLQALEWMLERESRVEDSLVHPLWKEYFFEHEDHKVTEPEPFYVNVYTRAVSLKPPNPPCCCRGGILADEMGMGKTMCVLSLILESKNQYCASFSLQNSTTKGDVHMDSHNALRNLGSGAGKTIRPTLIVCPTSLVGQWKSEVKAKIDKRNRLSAVIFHSQDRAKNMDLSQYDVVITTYGVVASEFTLDKAKSKLFSTNWHRCVLDEGHVIKNHSTNQSIACSNIRAKCRWVLTGTPVQNSIDDLYGLINFLKLEPWCNYSWWSRIIAKPYEKGKHKEVYKIVRAILQDGPLLLRRTKKTTAGFEVKLPEKRIHEVKLGFSENEQRFYDSLVQRTKAEFDGFVASGTLRQNYAAIFTLLLRLRQACDHPFLVLDRSNKKQKDDDHSNVLAEQSSFAQNGIMEKENSQSDISQADSNINDMHIRNRKPFAELDNGNKKIPECPVCLDCCSDPVITECGHVVCRECLFKDLHYFQKLQCPVCQESVSKKDVATVGISGSDRTSNHSKMSTSSKLDWLLRSLNEIRNINSGLNPQGEAKQRFVADTKDDIQEDPVKVVIFSQWTSFLDIIEESLNKSKLKRSYVRLDGTMSRKARDETIEKFKTEKRIFIFLISLKAGALGLNLTVASVVYILDPWFNPSIEDQAINRCHRIGQHRPVIVYRLMMEGTVEEKILLLQRQKQEMASNTLSMGPGDGTESRNMKLSFDELINFFK